MQSSSEQLLQGALGTKCATWHIPGSGQLIPELRTGDGFGDPKRPRPSEPSDVDIVFCPGSLYPEALRILRSKFSPRALTVGEVESLGFDTRMFSHSEFCGLCEQQELAFRVDRENSTGR